MQAIDDGDARGHHAAGHRPALVRPALRRDAAALGRDLPGGARPGRALGFDETFGRMWHFYLDYSRAGFASGYIDVQQLTLAREAR